MTPAGPLHIVTPVNRLLSVPLALLVTPAFGALLYDPASGQMPHQLGTGPWNYLQQVEPFTFSSGVTSPVSAEVSGGRLNFDTTGGSVRAGWSTSPGPMNRASGYTLSFGLQILTETTGSDNRAGFSVIALSSDLQGIELAFWDSEVWAQNTGFTHGEGSSAFSPASALINYDLTIQGSTYTLKANDTPVLAGSLRDYSGGGTPYTTPNFVFFGDNTFSAAAEADLGTIGFTAVPEPAEWTVLGGLGLLGFAVLRRRAHFPRA